MDRAIACAVTCYAMVRPLCSATSIIVGKRDLNPPVWNIPSVLERAPRYHTVESHESRNGAKMS